MSSSEKTSGNKDLDRAAEAVDAIVAKLQWVLIDTDVLFHNKTRHSPQAWMIRRNVTLFIYVFYTSLLVSQMIMVTDHEILNNLVEVWRFYSGTKDRRLYSTMTICFTFTGLYMSLFVRKISKTRRGEYILRKVLEPLRVLKGDIRAEDYGISQEQLRKLHRHAINGQKIAQSGLYCILFGVGNYYVYMLISKLDWMRYPQAAIVTVLAQLWVFAISASLCFMALFFYLTCRMLALRADNFVAGSRRYDTPVGVLNKHHDIKETILILNQFWCRYIFAVHVAFLPTITTIAFTVFFSKLHNMVIRVFLFVVLVESCGFLTFTCLSAASMSRAVIAVDSRA